MVANRQAKAVENVRGKTNLHFVKIKRQRKRFDGLKELLLICRQQTKCKLIISDLKTKNHISTIFF